VLAHVQGSSWPGAHPAGAGQCQTSGVIACNAVHVQRYWIEFEGGVGVRRYTPLGWGAGVTAWSVSQALRMAGSYFGSPLRSVARVAENVDVSLLDLSSWACSVPVWPGIWWPR
jgi:hypothetical protein